MSLITISQIIVSVALIALILLQERESGVSGLFGGEGSGIYAERRGMEKIIFVATIILLIVFAALALLNLVLRTP